MVRRVSVRAGVLVLAFVLLLAAENLAIGIGYRRLVAGSFEMGMARLYASPITLAALVPLALGVAAWSAWFERAPRRARLTLAAGLGLAAGIALAVAPTGRVFGSLGARLALGLVATLGCMLCAAAAVRAAEVLARTRRRVLVAVAAAAVALFWSLDAFLFARQYPSLHALLALLCVVCTCVAALGLTALPRKAALAALGFGLACIPWSLHAARALHTADNLRMILLEHAPLMGRGVALAARIAPVATEAAGAAPAAPASAGRTLHWNERSVLMVTVDALRADHVSAYGYSRPTTPVFDRLAEQAALFEYAYCATPHTSYSLTSLMTGKYMHPLRAMGLGEDSETWADLFRHYGYRTAGFYPPAVFFVDEDRFDTFRDRHLGFEYFKVEFASPDLRVAQITEYLTRAPAGVPIFLWVHLFEPHEPYVFHPEHPFGSGPNPSAMDAYDSEIALSDATLGRIVAAFDAVRPDNVLVVSADHGEEFGEHGGRYHGSSVYEEQVRVPLLVRGAGVKPGRIRAPVQTLDLLPTFLSASGTPRPPRIRGRDLGPLLTGQAADDEGFAFAEVTPLAMVARGSERLICRRAENACALYDVSTDPLEARDLGAERPERVRELRALWQRTELDHGRMEGERGSRIPAALRRGLQGDRDAAPEVAALLDDVDVTVRRSAALVLGKLASEQTIAQMERALTGSERDAEVRGLLAVALTRSKKELHPELLAFAQSSTVLESRRLAALALAERGNGSRLDVILAGLERGNGEHSLDEDESIAMIHALEALHAANPDPVQSADIAKTLLQRLADVRLRPYVVRTLGALGDVSARAPLLEVFRQERNFAVRVAEADALLELGVQGEEFNRALTRFAGMPEPIAGALGLARRAHLLVPAHAGAELAPPRTTWSGRAAPGAQRLFVELTLAGTLSVTAGESTVATATPEMLHQLELPGGGAVQIRATAPIQALWLVPLSAELPAPPPEEWDAGVEAVAKP